MRQIAAVMALTMIFLQAVRISYQWQSRQLQMEELNYAVETAVRHSLQTAVGGTEGVIRNDEELYADFLGELMLMYGDEYRYEIQIYQMDAENGVMDVSVSSFRKLPFGGESIVQCRKYAEAEAIS